MKLFSSVKHIFHNMRVKKQLYFIYFSAIFIPILIIGTFLLANTLNLLLTHYKNQAEADNVRVKSIMFDITTTVYNISDDLFKDKNLQDLLKTRYTSVQEAVKHSSNYTKLYNYIQKNAFISSIEIYTNNPTIYNNGYYKAVTDEIKNMEWYQQAVKQADIHWKSLERLDNWKHTTQELCLIRRIPVIATNEYAVLVIRISDNYLKNRIQNNLLINIVTVNQDPIFYSTERNTTGTNLTIPIDYSKSQYVYSGKLRFRNKDSIAYISTLLSYTSKDKIYISTIDLHAYDDARGIILICSAIILIASFLPFIMIVIFTNQFSSRIVTLRGEMRKASEGDYHIIDTFKGEDELSEAFSDLKVMIQSIITMNAKMYESEIKEQLLRNQQQKMEFKMLASQINPHFLYNTLETIRMKAFKEGNKDVANAIMLLGRSMHYVLENTGSTSTTLDKELEYISTYLAIQKLRFNDRVNYTLTIPDDMNLKEYQILPLLLQPIVENAIIHGLEGIEENGQISIDVKTNYDEFLLIDIYDNGLGMTEDALSSLMNNIKVKDETKTSSIGIYNINQRIKLFYGEAYGIQIKSCPNEGTLVSLTLPLHNMMEG